MKLTEFIKKLQEIEVTEGGDIQILIFDSEHEEECDIEGFEVPEKSTTVFILI